MKKTDDSATTDQKNALWLALGQAVSSMTLQGQQETLHSGGFVLMRAQHHSKWHTMLSVLRGNTSFHYIIDRSLMPTKTVNAHTPGHSWWMNTRTARCSSSKAWVVHMVVTSMILRLHWEHRCLPRMFHFCTGCAMVDLTWAKLSGKEATGSIPRSVCSQMSKVGHGVKHPHNAGHGVHGVKHLHYAGHDQHPISGELTELTAANSTFEIGLCWRSAHAYLTLGCLGVPPTPSQWPSRLSILWQSEILFYQMWWLIMMMHVLMDWLK